MFYIIYRITNIINNKIYIGVHKTNDLYDGYFGSGKYLNRSINKYGVENFYKEIMQIFQSEEEMFEMERLLVTENFVKRKDTYNLKIGGEGNFSYINKNGLQNNNKDWKIIGLKISNSLTGKKFDLERIKILKKSHKYRSNDSYGKGFINKKHTIKSKEKIKKSSIGKHIGKKNSQYGTCWIYNIKLKENKKIQKNELFIWQTKGWIKGRKVKWDNGIPMPC